MKRSSHGATTLSLLSRIDFWLISKELCNTSTNILPSPLSDHKSIFIRTHLLASDNMSGFSSYWKINNSVLLYDEVKDNIIKIIKTNWNKAREENRYSSYWEFTSTKPVNTLENFVVICQKRKI